MCILEGLAFLATNIDTYCEVLFQKAVLYGKQFTLKTFLQSFLQTLNYMYIHQ
jgi:hypothetical protein